jgi:two-component system, cell cycle response regulator
LQRVIAALGHDCRSAEDGLEALQLHQSDPADVIVSDWEMPNLNGLELCEATRIVDDERYYTYFIFLTGFDAKECFLRGMEAGADDYLTKPFDVDELQARLTSAARVVALNRRLADANDELRRDSQAAFNLARTDTLTGVANRLRLEEDLPVLWAQAERYGHRCSAVLCDIDWFKAYNDHFGHLRGDTALRSVALTMAGQLRQCDRIYRYGGEEFLLLLPEQALGEGKLVAERVCRAVAASALRSVSESGVVTISAGVAELSLAIDQTTKSWLDRADAALYRAKANGRNRVEGDFTGSLETGWLEARP